MVIPRVCDKLSLSLTHSPGALMLVLLLAFIFSPSVCLAIFLFHFILLSPVREIFFLARLFFFLYTLESTSSGDDSTRLTTSLPDAIWLERLFERNTINLNVLEIRFILLLYFTLSRRCLFPLFSFLYFALLNTSLQVSDMNTQNIFKLTAHWMSE